MGKWDCVENLRGNSAFIRNRTKVKSLQPLHECVICAFVQWHQASPRHTFDYIFLYFSRCFHFCRQQRVLVAPIPHCCRVETRSSDSKWDCGAICKICQDGTKWLVYGYDSSPNSALVTWRYSWLPGKDVTVLQMGGAACIHECPSMWLITEWREPPPRSTTASSL